MPRPQQQHTESETPIIDLTSSSAASQQVSRPSIIPTAPQQGSGPATVHSASQHPSTPIIMTFSASGMVIRSPQWTKRLAYSTLSSSMVQEPDVTVLESWSVGEVQALPKVANAHSNAPSNQSTQASSLETRYPSSNLTTLPQCQCK